MIDICPYATELLCNKTERTDEFFRQMYEAMLANKPIVYGTANKCPAMSYDCIKLQEFREKQK